MARNTRSSNVMSREKHQAVSRGVNPAGPLLPPPDANDEYGQILQNRERIARLLRLFSSPRKRKGLRPEELLIFFAIGYLGIRISNCTVQIIPIGMVEVAALLGIPKESVRRKVMRLVELDYVITTPKGVFVKDVRVWCQMLGHAII
ncbi:MULTISPECIES: hypothetical protein [unclassified Bradyrhizobium]|uniref:hypothetical protein n=1 Tax=unclassified Bradyrhizobium TaxID=2631580 RepID=UPI0028EED322|nr:MULTISPECIES: hypothetical protein [unclassified Bradyrhizobium]